MRTRLFIRHAPAAAALVSVLAAAVPALAQDAPIRSPEVAADRRVTFRLAAPKAAAVAVTCECLRQPQPMEKDPRGVWSATVGPFEPDIYEYEFTVDGLTIIDPRNEKVKYNSRPSTVSSLLDVPADAPRFHDVRAVPHGSVEIRWYQSRAANAVRRLHVYTPPGYASGRDRLPVLYLLHGADGDDSAWAAFGRANHILDNLMADGKITPMVVVMPFGYAHPPTAGVPAEQQRSDFERDLIGDIIPFIQSNYRVRADRNHRALVGLSMGGGQALTIGLSHTDLFSRVAGFSAAVPRDPAVRFKDVLTDVAQLNKSLALLWVGCGTDDSLYGANQAFAAFLGERGVKHTFRSTAGAHTWSVWRQYLLEVAPLLFPKT